MSICACSDDSVYELLKQPNTFILENCPGKYKESFRKVISHFLNMTSDLEDKDADIICLCSCFLDIKNRFDDDISIWNFINDFLEIPYDSGYDYLLLNYLENEGYMEHGNGIRCGWSGNTICYESKHHTIIIDYLSKF